MTSSLRRKRQITLPAANTLVRTAASLVGLGLFLAGSGAFAQDADSSARWQPSFMKHAESSAAPAPKTLYFSKEPAPPLPPAEPTPPASVQPTDPAPVFAPSPVAPAARVPASSVYVPAQPVPHKSQPPVPSFGLQQTAMQQPAPMGAVPAAKTPDETESYNIQLEPPGPHRLFRLESERSLFERMRQEALTRPQPERIDFPQEPDVSQGQTWMARQYPPMSEVVEPCYQCYGRLFFEELNSERYGWDLGIIQPFVSAGLFAKDFVLLPYHWGTDPCRYYECNAGYCLPGDPIPYYLYPPGLSVKGLVAEGVAWVAIAAAFP